MYLKKKKKRTSREKYASNFPFFFCIVRFCSGFIIWYLKPCLNSLHWWYGSKGCSASLCVKRPQSWTNIDRVTQPLIDDSKYTAVTIIQTSSPQMKFHKLDLEHFSLVLVVHSNCCRFICLISLTLLSSYCSCASEFYHPVWCL